MPTHEFDVIIAGTGIYGTSLGAILARQGARVLLIERGRHPRFALGEALLPQSAIWPFVLAQRFGVPELGHLSHADRIVDHITPTCGLKHSIGFAWHAPGETASDAHVHQLVPPHLPFYSESHLYREDIDLFLLEAARRHGCAYVDETAIDGVTWDADAVTVRTADRAWTAALFVDATGGRSCLASQEAYRDDVPRARTHSRCIFSHVEGLPPIDDWLDAASEGRRLHDGTFHHMFPGGWLWVIPFDNFSRSTSPLASIGLMLDPRIHPEDPGLSPEQEFRAIVDRFPTISAQMKDIRAARPFQRTGRLQYSSRTSVGHRHVLAPSTYGFIDPIYSNGLVHAFESVYRVAHHVLGGLGHLPGHRPDPARFTAEGLSALDALHEAQWADADRMAASAYAAMHAPDTWGAWTQAWLAQVLFSDLWLQRACFRFFASGRPEDLDVLLEGTRPGSASPLGPTRDRLLDDLAGLLASGRPPATIAADMLERLRDEAWLPRHVYDWGHADAQSIDFSRPDVAGPLLDWGFTASPEPLRSQLFDFTLPGPPPA